MSTIYAGRDNSKLYKSSPASAAEHLWLTPGSDDSGDIDSSAGTLDTIYFWTYPDDPGVANWPTGDYVVSIVGRSSGGAANVNVRVQRVNSAGVIIEQTSIITLNFPTGGSPTTQTATFSSQSWGLGEQAHQLRVELDITPVAGFAIESLSMTAPWTASAEVTWTLNDSAPVSLAMTFASIPSEWAYDPWEFPPYIIQGPDAATARLRMLMGLGQ